MADRLDLRRDIDFDTTVVAMSYSDEAAEWTVRTEGGATVAAPFVVAATPDIVRACTAGAETHNNISETKNGTKVHRSMASPFPEVAQLANQDPASCSRFPCSRALGCAFPYPVIVSTQIDGEKKKGNFFAPGGAEVRDLRGVHVITYDFGTWAMPSCGARHSSRLVPPMKGFQPIPRRGYRGGACTPKPRAGILVLGGRRRRKACHEFSARRPLPRRDRQSRPISHCPAERNREDEIHPYRAHEHGSGMKATSPSLIRTSAMME